MNIETIEDADLIARLGHSEAPRTTDVLHLSEIYGDMMRKMQPKRFKGGPMDMARVETGLVFENVLEQGLREKFATIRPGELVSDEGIWMSPDGFNPTLVAGEEYKATWMSVRPEKGCASPYTDEYGMPRQKFLHWFIQMKGYARQLGVDRFLLRALHVNGDYGRPMRPQFVSSLITFTEQEMADNWCGILNHARDMGRL